MDYSMDVPDDPMSAPVSRSTSRIRTHIRTHPSKQVNFPIVYVSPAGLLTVLLKRDMAVEMTIDRTVRVVNHAHKAVAATNGRGNSSCIYHTAAKIFQQYTSTDVNVFWDRKVRMVTENITFAMGDQCYNMSPCGLEASVDIFPDLSKDMSVNLLFSSSGYGPSLIPNFSEVAKGAKYTFHKRGGVTVLINGMRIFQNSRGDVMVACGPKYIRASPITGSLYLQTHFVEMAVESNWRVKVKRGEQQLLATFQNFFVSDGYFESGFDPVGQLLYQPVMVVTETLIDNTMPPIMSTSAMVQSHQTQEEYEHTRRSQSEGYLIGNSAAYYGGHHILPADPMTSGSNYLRSEMSGMAYSDRFTEITSDTPAYQSISQEAVEPMMSGDQPKPARKKKPACSRNNTGSSQTECMSNTAIEVALSVVGQLPMEYASNSTSANPADIIPQAAGDQGTNECVTESQGTIIKQMEFTPFLSENTTAEREACSNGDAVSSQAQEPQMLVWSDAAIDVEISDKDELNVVNSVCSLEGSEESALKSMRALDGKGRSDKPLSTDSSTEVSSSTISLETPSASGEEPSTVVSRISKEPSDISLTSDPALETHSVGIAPTDNSVSPSLPSKDPSNHEMSCKSSSFVETHDEHTSIRGNLDDECPSRETSDAFVTIEETLSAPVISDITCTSATSREVESTMAVSSPTELTGVMEWVSDSSDDLPMKIGATTEEADSLTAQVESPRIEPAVSSSTNVTEPTSGKTPKLEAHESEKNTSDPADISTTLAAQIDFSDAHTPDTCPPDPPKVFTEMTPTSADDASPKDSPKVTSDSTSVHICETTIVETSVEKSSNEESPQKKSLSSETPDDTSMELQASTESTSCNKPIESVSPMPSPEISKATNITSDATSSEELSSCGVMDGSDINEPGMGSPQEEMKPAEENAHCQSSPSAPDNDISEPDNSDENKSIDSQESTESQHERFKDFTITLADSTDTALTCDSDYDETVKCEPNNTNPDSSSEMITGANVDDKDGHCPAISVEANSVEIDSSEESSGGISAIGLTHAETSEQSPITGTESNEHLSTSSQSDESDVSPRSDDHKAHNVITSSSAVLEEAGSDDHHTIRSRSEECFVSSESATNTASSEAISDSAISEVSDNDGYRVNSSQSEESIASSESCDPKTPNIATPESVDSEISENDDPLTTPSQSEESITSSDSSNHNSPSIATSTSAVSQVSENDDHRIIQSQSGESVESSESGCYKAPSVATSSSAVSEVSGSGSSSDQYESAAEAPESLMDSDW